MNHHDPKAGTSTGLREEKIDPKHEQQQTPKITLKDNNVDLSSVKPKKKKEQKKPVAFSDSEGCADQQRKKQKMEPGQDQKKSSSASSTTATAM
jgi:hypothetical protein